MARVLFKQSGEVLRKSAIVIFTNKNIRSPGKFESKAADGVDVPVFAFIAVRRLIGMEHAAWDFDND